jgi:hypothetical protein
MGTVFRHTDFVLNHDPARAPFFFGGCILTVSQRFPDVGFSDIAFTELLRKNTAAWFPLRRNKEITD